MIPSLRAFLTAQNLGQYYDAFLEAGATDNDLPQLLRFNDDELNEFISAIHMPLFPALNLKRSLRELRHQQCVLSPSSSSSATTVSHHFARFVTLKFLNVSLDKVGSIPPSHYSTCHRLWQEEEQAVNELRKGDQRRRDPTRARRPVPAQPAQGSTV